MRDHTKSRRGCQQCKRRKVKCDEKLPCCTRCHRRREHCSYLQDYASSQSPSAPATPGSGDIQLGSDAGASSSYLVDLELTHFYLTNTYRTLWGRREGQLLWRDVIFKNALRYPALLNGLFAVCAMHCITLAKDPGEQNRYASIALQKQTAAIEAFVPLLHSFDDETAEIVFPMTMLVSYWGFATKRLPPQLSILSTTSDLKLASRPEHSSVATESTITQFLELIRRLRGIHGVHEARPSVLTGILAPLTQSPNPDEMPELPESTRNALETLRRHVSAVPGIVSTFHLAHPILSLEYIFRVALYSDFPELIVGWPVRVPEALIAEIRSGQNAALTILAYWAACFHSMNDRWWAEGWSTTLILEVAALVREPWRSLVDWPKKHVGLDVA